MKRLLIILLLLSFTVSAAAENTYYYFSDTDHPEHEGFKLLDYSQPTDTFSSYINLDEQPALWATMPFSADTKINGDVSITVFIEADFIRPELLPIQVKIIKASLIDVAPSGNVEVIGATRPTPLVFIRNETLKSTTFKLDNIEYVVSAGHSLGVKIEKTFDILSYFPFSIFSPFFSTNVLYDASYTKSYVLIPFNITGEGISLQCFSPEKEVRPGEDAIYTLIVYNNGDQQDTITIASSYTGGDWTVNTGDSQLTVAAQSFSYTDVTVTPPANATEGDYLNITITATGTTGSDSLWLNTSVAPPEYGVTVEALYNSLEAEPGEQVTFEFLVENTGDLYDTYDLFVTCIWGGTPDRNSVSLDVGESEQVSVSVTVPENATNGTTQVVGLTAQSRNSDEESTATSTLRVVYTAPSGGGSNFMTTIFWILFIVGVVVILILAYYLGRTAQKMVLLECDERVAEVAPGAQVAFTVRLINPLEKTEKGKQRYRLKVEGRIPERWKAELSQEEVVIDGGDEAEVTLEVQIPEDSPLDEWTSLDVVATPQKGKSERLNLLITLREPEERLQTEITHEPEEFGEGERVVTTVTIENVGEKTAENKKVILFVNGKEKNRIEGITIKPNAHVKIELPWIAEEENEIEVRVE